LLVMLKPLAEAAGTITSAAKTTHARIESFIGLVVRPKVQTPNQPKQRIRVHPQILCGFQVSAFSLPESLANELLFEVCNC
jgi:hypothetical protein